MFDNLSVLFSYNCKMSLSIAPDRYDFTLILSSVVNMMLSVVSTELQNCPSHYQIDHSGLFAVKDVRFLLCQTFSFFVLSKLTSLT